MRVYIAAPWVRKQETIEAGKLFTAAGHTVTSRWFNHEGDPNDPVGTDIPEAVLMRHATEDLYDVLTSEALIVLNLAKSEGKAVEMGMAMAASIPVISVGARSNIFQSLVTEVATVEDAIKALETKT